ncbi:sialate O-acetylesterase [Coraliomargarita sp. SDUM461003]|uniref:Sialate O-acetylesterase n=1 Tax=Thalassobacterium maritimum TaxID=3041265 RepID=A0ABU1AYB7_9BACT|nr:sialate O-acetylesterase [Coraliomargarita sp. SDUM461003]MDQ8209153.1 sialate O-acetylesterase [Coraliomargarita sp. SDUM461003]
MVSLFFVAALFVVSFSSAAPFRAYHVGNSLTWDALDSAKGFPALLESQGIYYEYDYHIRCGRSLTYIWNHPDETCVAPVEQTFLTALAGNEWDVVTLQPYRSTSGGETTLNSEVEAIINIINVTRSNPANDKTRFIIHAAWPEYVPEQAYHYLWDADFNPDASFLLNEASLRLLYKRVREELPEGVALSLNPAGWCLEELERQIVNDEISFDQIDDFYRDSLHMSLSWGRWLISNSLYAAMFETSPAGISVPGVPSAFGSGVEAIDPLDADKAKLLQELAWEVYLKQPHLASDKPLRVVLVMGQSNAVGAGTWAELSDEMKATVSIDYIRFYEEGLGRLLESDTAQIWVPEAKFGPELGLSSVLQHDDSDLMILKYAVGGTSIAEHWAPHLGPDERLRYGLFDKWKAFYRDSLQDMASVSDSIDVVGLVWMQGKSDALNGYSRHYKANLAELLSAIRAEVGDSELPILLGRIHSGLETFTETEQLEWFDVRRAQMEVANGMQNCWWLNTDFCQRRFQNTDNHYDTQGSFDLGILFGEALNVVLERDGLQSEASVEELGVTRSHLSKELSFVSGVDFLSANQGEPVIEMKRSSVEPSLVIRQRILTGNVDSELECSSDLNYWGPSDQFFSKLLNDDPTDGLVRFELSPFPDLKKHRSFMRLTATQDTASTLSHWKERKQQYLAGEIDRLNVVVIGDSWVHGSERLTEPLRDLFQQDLYEDGGVGYVNFGWYRTYDKHMDLGADSRQISGNKTTGWHTEYSKACSLAGSHIYSSEQGESITLDLKVAHDYGEIHYYVHPGGGDFKYRVAGGDWHLVETDGVGEYRTVEIIGISGVTGDIDIELADAGSEGVILMGAYFRNDTGVVVNKCGKSGATAYTFLSNVLPGVYEPAFESLEPDLVIMLLGTSEQISNHSAHTPYQFHLRMKGLIERTHEAAPSADIICMVPAVNAYDLLRNYSMLDYRDVSYYVANLSGAAFIDLTEIFGEFDSYKYDSEGNTLGWFIQDGKHPSVEGAKVVAQSIYDLLE